MINNLFSWIYFHSLFHSFVPFIFFHNKFLFDLIFAEKLFIDY